MIDVRHSVFQTGPRRAVLLAALGFLFLALSGAMHAQAPAPAPAAPSTRDQAAANRLPVQRVVLYKSGVGYFEHVGRVRGNQTVAIEFTSGQLDDALASLTALDLNGGRVTGVSYNSQASLDRRLGALRLPVGTQTTRAQFLNALRGARLEVTSGATRVTGRLLSVERTDRRADGVVTNTDTISVVSDAGELRTFPLDGGVSVRILETDVNQEVSQYLSLVSSARDEDIRRLSISTTGTGDRDLYVSYVSEVPVWKATYRLVLPSSAPAPGAPSQPLLQGWAIVDNTVGQDWDNVQLSLVAGAPQSFIQQISQPYYVQRPVVPLPERFLLAPQTHQSAIGTAGAGSITGSIADIGGGILPGVSVRVSKNGAPVVAVVSDSSGRYQIANLPPDTYQVDFVLNGFTTVTRPIVAVTGGMETVLNTSMRVGVAGENVSVNRASTVAGLPQSSIGIAGGGAGGGRGGRGGGVAGGTVGGVPMAAPAPPPPPALDALMAAQQADATGGQLGDLFEYKLTNPVTIRKNQSALVPILSGPVQAEKVSLWNGSVGSRPLRAVWLTNSTGNTLDGGSFSIVEGQAFAGEGLMDPLKSGEKRLLSYAVDLGVTVDAKSDPVPARTTKVQVVRGVLIQTTEEAQRRTYTVRNDDTDPRSVVIEHPTRAGWNLDGDIKPAETTASTARFRVDVRPKTTATFVVQETHPGESRIAVTSITDQQLSIFLRDQTISPALAAGLRDVMAKKAEVARIQSELATRQGEVERIGADQDRVRENMKSLKGSSEEKQLLQRYVKQLDDQETRLETLRKEMASLSADQAKAQADLDKAIDALGTIG